MKKIIVLMLTFTLLLSVVACGGEKAAENKENTGSQTDGAVQSDGNSENTEQTTDDTTDENNAENNSLTVQGNDEKSALQENVPVAAGAPEVKTEKTVEGDGSSGAAVQPDGKTVADVKVPAESINTFNLGANDGKRYVNNYFGIDFVLPEGWKFSSEEKLDEKNGIAVGASAEEKQKALEGAKVLYGMTAQGGRGNANLYFENLGANSASVTEEQYLSVSTAKTKEAMEKGGVTNIVMESGKISVGKGTIHAVQMSYTVQGKNVYQMVFCMKKDTHMLVATIMNTDKAQNDAVLASFHAAE